MRAADKVSSQSELQQMVDLMYRLAPHEGYTLSALEGVKFMRSNRPFGRAPIFYEPLLCFVCQGRKHGYLGAKVYTHDAQQYLALSVPLPFEAETEASAEEPLLAVAINVNLRMVAELMLALNLDAVPTQEATCPQPMYTGLVDGELRNAVLRLLQALASPMDAKVLAASIVREIHYRVLMRDEVGVLHRAASQGTYFGSIAKALRRIHTDCGRQLDVSALADEVGLTVTMFVSHFDAVTSSSPNQYVKAMRLHQARLLMIRNGLNLEEVTKLLGYQSPSHFGDQFKNLFGRSPLKERAYSRSSLSILPAADGRRFVATM